MTTNIAVENSAVPADHLSVTPPRDRAADRERIEGLYLSRQISRETFHAWLRQGGHHVF